MWGEQQIQSPVPSSPECTTFLHHVIHGYISFMIARLVHVAVTYEPTTECALNRIGAKGCFRETSISQAASLHSSN